MNSWSGRRYQTPNTLAIAVALKVHGGTVSVSVKNAAKGSFARAWVRWRFCLVTSQAPTEQDMSGVATELTGLVVLEDVRAPARSHD